MKKAYRVCSITGLLLLAAALCLTVYNIVTDMQAGESTRTVLEELAADILPTAFGNEANMDTEIGAGEKMQGGAEESLPEDGKSAQEIYIPDYLLNPQMDMPQKEIGGKNYIGILQIPDLSLELPVMGEWSYKKLKIAPCRYSGSVYLDTMVIAAHNYASHFGRLKELSLGAEVLFTDIDGNLFSYEVAEVEILPPYATEEMTSGEWDLTLFTCTVGGQSRVTIRCTRKRV